MKLFLINAAFMLAGGVMNAQSTGKGDWKPVPAEKNVSVSYEQGTCGGNNVIFFKIDNNNDQEVTVDLSAWGAASKKISLKAHETISGSCTNRLPAASLVERIPASKTVNDLKPSVAVQIVK